MAGTAVALGAVVVLAATTFANGPALTDAGAPNTKTAGISLPDKLSPQWREVTVAQGSNALENPSALTSWYGYFNDGPTLPAPGAVQAPGKNVEATKSEPDKNTYLDIAGQHGADPAYDYGTHFLYQGHELDTANGDYITRINLDADAAHRVTKLAETETDGDHVPEIDGSTWDPFAQRLLFTTEGGDEGGLVEATLDYPSKVSKLWGVFGQGGFEAVQIDDRGNVYIVEDSGGPAGTVNTHAKQPNSFLFRLLPTDPKHLDKGGKLQALQVNRSNTPARSCSTPVRQTPTSFPPTSKDLHTYGHVFNTLWVTVHDTSKDGTAAFDANAAAKKAGATPFKRPENGQFEPGTGFHKFLFAETGDTTLTTEAGSQYGGFGGRAGALAEPRERQGQAADLLPVGQGSLELRQRHVLRQQHVIFVEDQGDGLHCSLNALDSAFMFDVNQDYAGGAQPLKVIAEGRDPSATIDSAISGSRATASRTKATTSSPASTSRMAIRRPTAYSGQPFRRASCTAGGSSTPTSTATT